MRNSLKALTGSAIVLLLFVVSPLLIVVVATSGQQPTPAAAPIPTPNDETDDTEALQAWIESQKKGPLSPLPRGRFIVSESLHVWRTMGIRLVGSGGQNFGGAGWDRFRSGTILEWHGPPDQPVVVLSGCSGLVWDGINIVCEKPASAGILVKHGTGSLNFKLRDCGIVGGAVGIQWGEAEGNQTCANVVYDNVEFSEQTEAAVRLVNMQSLEHLFLLPQFRFLPLAIDVRAGGDVSVIGGGTYEVDTFLRLGNVASNTRGFDIQSVRFDGQRTRTAWLAFDDTDAAKPYGSIVFSSCSQNQGQQQSDQPLLTAAPGSRIVCRECSFHGSDRNWAAVYSNERAGGELYFERCDGLNGQKLRELVTTKGPRAFYEFRRTGNLYSQTGSLGNFPVPLTVKD